MKAIGIVGGIGPESTVDYYRQIIVAYRKGNPVRLGDVAQVLDSVENDKTASWLNGQRSILLAVQRQPHPAAGARAGCRSPERRR